MLHEESCGGRQNPTHIGKLKNPGDHMSEQEDSSRGSTCAEDEEACRLLNHEYLLNRVKKMNAVMEATSIPKHDVPIHLVVQDISRETMVMSWSRLCERWGSFAVAEHIRKAIRLRTPESGALRWQEEYPRSFYRSSFKPVAFEDEPSDSSEDETADK